MAIKRKQPLEEAAVVEKKRLKRNTIQEYLEAYVDKKKTDVEKKKIATMSTVKRRKLKQQHVERDDVDMKNNVTTILEDIISDLPDSLRLHILSFVDTKQAVRTSVLSKQWVSSWTSIPVLEFNSGCFKYIKRFDAFVYKVLSTRDHSVKMERLAFNHGKKCSKKILITIFDYVFKHGVKELELHISSMVREKNEWPIGLRQNSLTSLKLQSSALVDCPFLGPRSGSFKNLTALHLQRVKIKHPDSFSGFPMLEKLTLVDFLLNEDLGDILNVQALRLSELTISCHMKINQCVLTTPKLKCFEYRGSKFPVLKIHQRGGLPVLDTVVVDYKGGRYSNQLNQLFEELMKFFGVVYNAKSLKVLSAVTELLWMFHEELMHRYSPFLNLKGLTMDFSPYYHQNLFDSRCWPFELFEAVAIPNVKDYLLKNSPVAKFSKIYPKMLI